MELDPDEVLIMDSGRLPITYQEGKLRSINGRLYLTNKRLVFEPSRFQSIVGSFQLSTGSGTGYVEIPLESIESVEKGFMAHIKVRAGGREYSFKGMRGAGRWVASIEEAIRSAESTEGAARSAGERPAMRYCPYCGSPVNPDDIYCSNCGRKLPKA